MTDNQDLLAMTHVGEDPHKYMKSVTPPVFMNSLHVFDTVKDYFDVDIFNDELRPILNRYIKCMSEYDWLFPSRNGKNPITRQRAYQILSNAGKRFGLEAIGTHTLRKTFGYHFYQQTKDIATLKEILNHSDISVTFRYIGITQDIKDEKIRKLSFRKR